MLPDVTGSNSEPDAGRSPKNHSSTLAAISSGGVQLLLSASGIPARLAGVSIAVGRTPTAVL